MEHNEIMDIIYSEKSKQKQLTVINPDIEDDGWDEEFAEAVGAVVAINSIIQAIEQAESERHERRKDADI